MKEKLILLKNKALLSILLLTVSSGAAADGKVNTMINTGTSWIQGITLLGVALTALLGIWFFISGVSALVNREQTQTTPTQALGKVIGGIVLIAAMTFIGIFLTDLGVDSGQSTGGANSVFTQP